MKSTEKMEKSEAYKHKKYKTKYLKSLQNQTGGDTMNAPTFGALRPTDVLNEKISSAHQAGYDLLVTMASYYPNGKGSKQQLQIATSESLTGGLMFSTLVDIPWGGWLKYGCFGVYDTNAKRVFNNVIIEDVYTHKCAEQMAVGILANSNASIGLAVTGNAMPTNDHANMLGEVFIGVAGYNTNNGIIYKSTNINACKDFDGLLNICRTWYGVIDKSGGKAYNEREMTSIISNIIRNYTTQQAFLFCKKFIEDHKPIVPQEVIDTKAGEEAQQGDLDRAKIIPPTKYPNRMKYSRQCLSGDVCHQSRTPSKPSINASDLTNALDGDFLKRKDSTETVDLVYHD